MINGNEVGNFMRYETLDESYVQSMMQGAQARASPFTFASAEDDEMDMSRLQDLATAISSMGGGGSFGGSMTMPQANIGTESEGLTRLFELMILADRKKRKKEKKPERPPAWQNTEKTEAQIEKIFSRKGTKGEWEGHVPEGVGEGAGYYAEDEEGYIPVQSSNLSAVKYNSKEKQLNVVFLSGSEYTYQNVPRGKYNNLMAWSSHGSYFYWNIRGKGVPTPLSPPYPYQKI